MRFYVASPFAARVLGAEVAQQLIDAGHEVTSKWLLSTRDMTDETVGISAESTDEEVLAHAESDLEDIDHAHGVVMLTSSYVQEREPGIPEAWLHTGGRHVEMGYAIAEGKHVYLLGQPENIFARSMATQHSDVDAMLTFIDEYGRLQ